MWLGQQVGMRRGWSLMVPNLLLFAFPSIYSSIDRLISDRCVSCLTRPARIIFIDAMSEIEIMTELKVTAMLGFFWMQGVKTVCNSISVNYTFHRLFQMTVLHGASVVFWIRFQEKVGDLLVVYIICTNWSCKEEACFLLCEGSRHVPAWNSQQGASKMKSGLGLYIAFDITSSHSCYHVLPYCFFPVFDFFNTC